MNYICTNSLVTTLPSTAAQSIKDAVPTTAGNSVYYYYVKGLTAAS